MTRNDQLLETFHKRFNELLARDNTNANRLANETGISSSIMYQFKDGVKIPCIEHLCILAERFQVPVSYLIEPTEEETLGMPIRTVKDTLYTLLNLIESLSMEINTKKDEVVYITSRSKNIVEFFKLFAGKNEEERAKLFSLYKDFKIIDGQLFSAKEYEYYMSTVPKMEFIFHGISEEEQAENPEEVEEEIRRRTQQWDNATPKEREHLLCELTDK